MKRHGQAIVLLLAVILAMIALVIWITNIRGYVIDRLRTQDGGDAAALAAARWQAAGLNLCGELNVIQAYMLADDKANIDAAYALHELRQRVQLTTPILAVLAAQEVAEQNGMEELMDAADYFREVRESIILNAYYEGAEEDLRSMLGILIRQPIYAFPLTPIYETHDSLLTEQNFYEAILAKDWCWFWFHAYDFLQHYRQRSDFGQLPNFNTEPFFGLRLNEFACNYETLVKSHEDVINQTLSTLGHPTLPPMPEFVEPPEDPRNEEIRLAREERTATFVDDGAEDDEWIRWTSFDRVQWAAWDKMTSGELPIEGKLREGYDYKGTFAALSVTKNKVSWITTAKPFAKLDREALSGPTPLVLGGFETVRLIPVDAGDTGVRSFNAQWFRHLRNHVPDYYFSGTLATGCRYCEALRMWNNSGFRFIALEWLREHGHTCRRPKTGEGDTGGANYAH